MTKATVVNHLRLPLDQRGSMAAWRELYVNDASYESDPAIVLKVLWRGVPPRNKCVRTSAMADLSGYDRTRWGNAASLGTSAVMVAQLSLSAR